MNKNRIFFLAGLLILMIGLLLAGAFSSRAVAQESDESEFEAAKALAAEAAPTAPAAPRTGTTLLVPDGGVFPLFAGVDDVTVPSYLIEPTSNLSTTAFIGAEVWGSAYDSGNDRILFNDGTSLFEWPVGGAVNLLGTITEPGGAPLSMVGLAFYNGQLYGTRNVANEGVYVIDTGTLVATLFIDYEDGDFDYGGFAADPNDGTFYGTSDDTSPIGAGLYRINPDGSGTLIAPYPGGETDIDGLAVSDDGYAYLVLDQPGFIYVYDLIGGAYTTPLVNPWTTNEVFSGGAYIVPPVPEPLVCDGPAVAFESGIPADWSSVVWTGLVSWSTTDDLVSCDNGGNLTSGSGQAACADSDQINTAGVPYDAELFSNSFDLTGYTNVDLTFAANYNDIGGADLFEVWVWDNGAGTLELQWAEDHNELVVVDLSAYDGQPDVQVSFRYYGDGWDWWAQVDDVALSCDALEPDIDIDPQFIGSTQSQDTTTAHVLDISNVGNANLNWMIEETPVDCTTPADVPWVSVSPDNGTTAPAGTTSVDVTFDSTGLTAGTYTANLCVNSNDPDPGPGNNTDLAIVALELVVEEPDIDVNPLSLDSTQFQNTTVTDNLTISNTGNTDLIWTLSESDAANCAGGSLPWLGWSPGGGTTAPSSSDDVVATFDATGLAPGVYQGYICLDSNDPDTPQVVVPVMLTVQSYELFIPYLSNPPG